jgi:hypothetical protein
MKIERDIKPVFLVGFPRCASSTLTAILDSHSEIIFPENKGTNFFSTDEYSKGESYLFDKYFQHWKGEIYFGDGNPVHSFLPFVSKRMYKLFPDAKLIFSLREPVSRAYSNWWHNKEAGYENESFDNVISQELNILDSIDLSDDEYWLNYRANMLGTKESWRENPRFYLLRGYYALHIRRFLQFYPKEQMYFLSFSEFKKDTEVQINNILEFLSLDSNSQVNSAQHVNFAVKNEKVLNAINFANKLGINKLLPDFLKKDLKRVLSKKATNNKMGNDIKKEIEAYYDDKNVELKQLIGESFTF